MSPTGCNWVVVGSGVLDGPELPKAIKTMITAARLGPSGRPVPTRGDGKAAGASREPYGVVIGAVEGLQMVTGIGFGEEICAI